LGKICRLSADIGIIIESPLSYADATFDKVVVGSKLFTRFERQEREIDGLSDKEHYKFSIALSLIKLRNRTYFWIFTG
jgi:hypothetical protein